MLFVFLTNVAFAYLVPYYNKECSRSKVKTEQKVVIKNGCLTVE